MIFYNLFILANCPPPKLTEVQPKHFTAVVGYNITMKYFFDGNYSMWTNKFYCFWCQWVEHQVARSIGTNLNNCCKFELIGRMFLSKECYGFDTIVIYCTEYFWGEEAPSMCKCMTHII